MSSYQMMTSKLIGSKEALENFQFVTINGKIEFDELDKVIRIAYYYSKAVKAGINLALRGVSLNNAVKELYKIIPYAFYAETAYKQALALVENNCNRLRLERSGLLVGGIKVIRAIGELSSTFLKTTC